MAPHITEQVARTIVRLLRELPDDVIILETDLFPGGATQGDTTAEVIREVEHATVSTVYTSRATS